jgi:RNA polymerase sigma factor (sigma-70 family)
LLALVGPASQGNGAAMRALLTAVAPVVLRAARRMLGRDHPDIEDVAQQALVGLVDRLPLFRGESSVAHFAERIAVYRALTTRRDAGVRRRVVDQAVLEASDADSAPSPLVVAEARARLALLHDALDTLSPPQAEALALHFLFDHTVSEIAAMTDAAEETVRSRLRLGKQSLRANIEKSARLRALRDRPASDDSGSSEEDR